MKSSTIRRSTLSRESMEVIENLSKEQEQENAPIEYIRPEEEVLEPEQNKAQEIDLLWQNFKNTQFNTNSPTAYILIGFLIGVVTTLLIGGIVGVSFIKSRYGTTGVDKIFSKSQQEQTLEQQTDAAQQEVDNKVNIPSDETTEAPTTLETGVSENQAAQNEEQPAIDSSKMKKYVVKSGDTGESIIKHYYGSYSPEKAELIMKANNLKTLDRINIDQVLLIPVE